MSPLASDYLRARSDQPYLIGRACEVLFALDDIVHGGTGTGGLYTERTIQTYDQMGRRPLATLPRLERDVRRWAAAARELMPERVDLLMADYHECLARADIDRLPEVADPTGEGEWSSPMASGRAHQHAEYLRINLDAARKGLEDSLAAAKEAAVALVESGTSEAEAGRRVGLDRMTVRKARGK